MTYLPLVLCALMGMGIVSFLVPFTLRAFRHGTLLNRSGDLHHTHESPVPRVGGAALAMAFVGIECFITIFYPEQRAKMPGRLAIILSSLAIFGLGFWDDIRPLGAKRKLLGQVLIAATVCCFGIGIQTFKIPFTSTIIDLHGWGVLITILWLVGMTNLINLVDGVDGLAAGICLMLMALLAYVGHRNGSFEMLTAGMAGALLGFL